VGLALPQRPLRRQAVRRRARRWSSRLGRPRSSSAVRAKPQHQVGAAVVGAAAGRARWWCARRAASRSASPAGRRPGHSARWARCPPGKTTALGQNDPDKSLKTSLKAEIDLDAWESLNSEVSVPFAKPSTGRIAVKVMNHLGDEVMKVYRVKLTLFLIRSSNSSASKKRRASSLALIFSQSWKTRSASRTAWRASIFLGFGKML